VLIKAQGATKRRRDGGGGWRTKLHVVRALERRGELESRVERCGEGHGWCSPFIGAGGALRRQLPEG
jgi:hypothetical protein